MTVPLTRPLARTEVVLRPHPPRDEAPSGPARRCKIWELAETLHCSVIGTCLTNAEVRQVLGRLGVKGAETLDEHELHVVGVLLAGNQEAGAKHLQKALDKRHAAAIKQFAKARDEDALLRLWDESTQKGEIPGAYWAILTHPIATEAIAKRAFQDVHMLSHLVGAANRADIRRLRQLETEMESLQAKLQRQEMQLRDGFRARDETIRRLNEALLCHIEQPLPGGGVDHRNDIEVLQSAIKDLNRRLGQETARRQRVEGRSNELFALLMKAEGALQRTERERDAARRDLESVESHLDRFLDPAPEQGLDLSSATILYVGGQTRQIPHLKALVERTGARFVHHDGGVEHSTSLLPGLVGRANVVCFPIDCISHDAVITIKRLCRQSGIPYRPLRTASVATLMSVLVTMPVDPDALAAAQ